MTAATEKTVDLALSRALLGATGSVRVLRVANVSFSLPTDLREDANGDGARVAVVDARSLDATIPALLEGAPAGVRVVVVTPVTRDGGRGVLTRLTTGLRRLTPATLTDVCDALRRGGVVSVRVIDVQGSLGLAVVSGRTTQQ